MESRTEIVNAHALCPSSGVLVIGWGNEDRGDDAAGRVVARRLHEGHLDGVRVLVESCEGAALIDAWRNAPFVILIAAVYSTETPGTIHRIDARSEPVITPFSRYSSRAFCLAETVELARAVNQLPARFILFGIVGKSFEGGTGLSPAVEAAVEQVTQRVRQEIHPRTGGLPSPGSHLPTWDRRRQ